MNKFIIVFILSIVTFVTLATAQSMLIFVKPVDVSFPDSLYKSVGTKTFNVQYIKLFSDESGKGYIVKAWYFQPGNQIVNFKIRLIDEKNKKEYIYEFTGTRDKSYVRLKNILVLCPSNFRIFVNDQEVPDDFKKVSDGLGGDKMPGDILKGAMVRILQRSGTTFKEIQQGEVGSKDEEIILQIIAGTFPTGGYSIQLNEPDIVFPIAGKRGKITITGIFVRPGKGDMVTQAFTTPTNNVSLGKLPVGEYDIYVNIENLGEFLLTLSIK